MDATAPTARFSNRVADYVKARPSYPSGVIDLLTRVAGGRATVADVGSGTGIFARLLLDAGHTVYAVEPNGPMREAAEAALGGHVGFRSIAAPAEATTLPAASVDLFTAAQAFHWFDRVAFRAECVRLLKPGGHVAIIWNSRPTEGTPFLDGYERLLHRFGTDYTDVNHRNLADADLAAFFAPAPSQKHTFANAQHLDFDGLTARLLSSSYAPPADDPRSGPMLVALRELFDASQADGHVEILYNTEVFLGQLGT